MDNGQLTLLSPGEASLNGRVRLCRTLTRPIWGSTVHPTDEDEALHSFSKRLRPFADGWIRGRSPFALLQSIPAGHGQSRPVTVIFDGKASVHAKARPDNSSLRQSSESTGFTFSPKSGSGHFDSVRPDSTYFDQKNKKHGREGFAVSGFAGKAEIGANDGEIRHYSALSSISGERGCQGYLAGRRAFVTGQVPVCDGKCYGFGIRKYLINKICDVVPAEYSQKGGWAMLPPPPHRLWRTPEILNAKFYIYDSKLSAFIRVIREIRGRIIWFSGDGPPSLFPASVAFGLWFDSGPKNQGGSRWLKLNQGGSRHFETFFYEASRNHSPLVTLGADR